MLPFIVYADIPLLPSISSVCCSDDEEPGGIFTVHWLNNKELHFTLAMEVFLQQLQGSLQKQNEDNCFQEGTVKYLEHALNLCSRCVSVNRSIDSLRFRSQI